MPRLKTRSIERGILGIFLASFAVVAVLLAVLIAHGALRNEDGEIESTIRESSLAMLASLEAAGQADAAETVPRAVIAFQRSMLQDEVRRAGPMVAIYDHLGTLVVQEGGWPGLAPPQPIVGWTTSAADDRTLRGFGARGGRWWVVQWLDADEVRRLVLHGIAVDLAKYLVLAAPILVIPIVLALRIGLAPLRRLTEELRFRSVDDFRPFETPPYRELAPIATALNEMAARRGEAVARERALIQNSAHALTTPLFALVARARALSEGPIPIELRSNLEKLEQTAERTARLGRQLLKLSLVNAETDRRLETVEVMDFLREALAEVSEAARRAETPLELIGPDALDWPSNTVVLRCVIDNLLSNALQYAPGGEGIVVQVLPREDDLTILVHDDGPGIAEPDRERIFERFVRLGQTPGTGAGLGLAITRQALTVVGGRIRATVRSGRPGACFEITLPRPSSAGATSWPGETLVLRSKYP
jgi:signal transduction histidine kinase